MYPKILVNRHYHVAEPPLRTNIRLFASHSFYMDGHIQTQVYNGNTSVFGDGIFQPIVTAIVFYPLWISAAEKDPTYILDSFYSTSKKERKTIEFHDPISMRVFNVFFNDYKVEKNKKGTNDVSFGVDIFPSKNPSK